MSNKEIRKRDSNIELLRILAISGVIVLHFNGYFGHGFSYVTPGGGNAWILYLLQNIFICAVNLFILISGYFLSNSYDRSLWKPIKLIIYVSVFNEFFYLFKTLVEQKENFLFRNVLGATLPCNYFIILYCVLYIISPYLNLVLNNLEIAGIKKLITISVLLFSVYPTLLDMMNNIVGHEVGGLSSISLNGSQAGYQIVNFALMYIIGASLRKIVIPVSKGKLAVVWAILVCMLLLWSRGNQELGFGSGTAWEYCNPLVIAEAVVTFMLFKNMKIKNSRVCSDPKKLDKFD